MMDLVDVSLIKRWEVIKMLKAKILIPVIAMGIIATGAALWSTGIAKAQNNGKENMASKLAEKLNLDQSTVDNAMDQIQTERRTQMHEQMETKLNEAVKKGTINEDQKTAILNRQTDMQKQREAEKSTHDKWLTDNNLDQSTLQDLGIGMGRGMGMGGGMKGHGSF